MKWERRDKQQPKGPSQVRNKVSQVRVQHGGHEKCWAGGVVSPDLSEAMVLNVTERAVSA